MTWHPWFIRHYMEEVLFAAERIEWIQPGEDEFAGVSRAPATAAGGGALSAKAKAVVVAKRTTVGWCRLTPC